MITIVGYGMGNVSAIQNMLFRCGAEANISSDPAVIAASSGLVLPGVGAFDNAMYRLRELSLIEILQETATQKRVPILGICLGMQLFARRSAEGVLPGFGWIDADCHRISQKQDARLKVPHMGWNSVSPLRKGLVLPDDAELSRFYFLHSYHVVCDHQADIVATTSYGESIVAMLERDNIIGVQFHPEKSHRFGFELMRKFTKICQAPLGQE
jgi:glutamine amidotransferase